MKLQMKKADGTLDSRSLAAIADWVIAQAVSVQRIPAPTFEERERAELVSALMTQHGLQDIDIDAMHNVYGRLPGADSSLPALMIVAHTDTVFGSETDLTLRREVDTLHGPGIGDNSLGVGGMLGIMHLFTTTGRTPDRDLWFVATSCEEGLGDLKGMRAAFARLQDRVGAVVNIEGLAFGHVYHAGIAVKRLRITARTGGGHSWLHYGRPSAIHALMQLGAKISALKPPHTPRTTFNIGLIEGGTSINSIASRADIWLDLRSEEMNALAILEEEVYRLIYSLTTPDVAFDVEVVGERPAGYISPEHPLVRAAVDALAAVGVRATLETGSTDGNIALAAGCPTVTVGVTRGGNAHRLDEYAETGPVKDGMQQLFQLVLTAQARNFSI
jgi:acetylornithine deacetylase/succinyl-diaminopimelate desuccinylase-like protein